MKIFVRLMRKPGDVEEVDFSDKGVLDADHYARQQFYGDQSVRMATVYQGNKPLYQYQRNQPLIG